MATDGWIWGDGMGEVSGELEVEQGFNRDYREEKLKLRVIWGDSI